MLLQLLCCLCCSLQCLLSPAGRMLTVWWLGSLQMHTTAGSTGSVGMSPTGMWLSALGLDIYVIFDRHKQPVLVLTGIRRRLLS
jgi:hypothetical protein